ncbi:hypothetical protein [Azospirillum doebereinerae]
MPASQAIVGVNVMSEDKRRSLNMGLRAREPGFSTKFSQGFGLYFRR